MIKVMQTEPLTTTKPVSGWMLQHKQTKDVYVVYKATVVAKEKRYVLVNLKTGGRWSSDLWGSTANDVHHYWERVTAFIFLRTDAEKENESAST